MKRAVDNIQWLLDMGSRCMEKGKQEEIATRFMDRYMPEVEKIRAVRGEGIYEYMSGELVPSLSKNFTNYYVDLHQNQ